MGCNERPFQELPPAHPWLKLPCKSGLQWAAMRGLFRNNPPDWNCHVRVGCNGLQWEEFSEITPLDWNCHVRVGCNGLQWEDFSGITPWLKLPCKSGVQWKYFWGSTPPDRNCHVRVGCNGLQWEDFSGITLPPWLKLQCKSGLQWAAMGGLFRNYPPLTEIAMQEWAAMGCNERPFQE